jgi:hypothetical protein
MTIDARPRGVVFNSPPEYDRTSLSQVAANLVMEGALQAQADALQAEYGPKEVKEALSAVHADGRYLRVNSISDTLDRMKAWQASDPFKDDYPDVRAQRQYALSETIADAEQANRETPPEFHQQIASIVTAALVQEASSGSLEAADVLLSDHVPAMWERATGSPEVPEEIFPDGSVVIVSV